MYFFVAVKESSKREIDSEDTERKKLKKENSIESSTSPETEKKPVSITLFLAMLAFCYAPIFVF